MPMPFNYRSATPDFEAYLNDVMELGLLQTSNQAYQATRAVFHVFRSHVERQVAMDFAQFLPAVLRAIFVEDWNLGAPVTPFSDPDQLLKEVLAVRPDHNVSPPSAIHDVAVALRNCLKAEDHALMLKNLPLDARHYWTAD
ncbi:MAG: DUF2267 domain-containing protein [Aestuariivirga sp.]